MTGMFLQVVNMSISACWIVLAVLLIRLLLKKAPKWIRVMLWMLVAVRLICPFFVESRLSLVPSTQTLSPTIMTDEVPQIHTGIGYLNSAVNPIISESFAPTEESSSNPLQIWVPVLTAFWITGIVCMLGYMLISYWRLHRKMITAVRYEGNVWQSHLVASPFVLGLIRPKVYIPFAIESQDRTHVIAHERAHIQRKDHWWKPLGFLLLSVHWFNPLLWVGYILLCRDIELACDEKVVKDLDALQRADYSQSLLSCAVRSRTITACPLAFGEGNIKRRVQSVLNYKKPTFWILILAVLAITAAGIFFLTDPVRKPTIESAEPTIQTTEPEETDPLIDEVLPLIPSTEYLQKKYPQYFNLPVDNGLHIYIWQMAQDSYSCVLLPGREVPYTQEELWDYHNSSTTIKEMRAIVAHYGVTRDRISIIPIQMMYSSYAYTVDEAYCENLEKQFWEMHFYTFSNEIASIIYDIDGDGVKEQCCIGYGPTSGLFTFTFTIWQDGVLEYYSIMNSRAGDISFVETEDGLRLKIITWDMDPKTILYDIVLQENMYLLISEEEQLEFWGAPGMVQ